LMLDRTFMGLPSKPLPPSGRVNFQDIGGRNPGKPDPRGKPSPSAK
jgi:hypothetical protein